MTDAHAAGARHRAETLEATRLTAIRVLLAGGPFDEARLGIRETLAHRRGRKRSRRRTARELILRAANVGAVLAAVPMPQTSWAWCDGRRPPARGLQRPRRMGRRRPAGRRTPRLHRQPRSRLSSPSRSHRAGPWRRSATRAWPCRRSCGAAPAAAEQLVAHALGTSPGPADVPAQCVKRSVPGWSARAVRRRQRAGCTCPSAPCATTSECAADLRGRPLDENLPALATALRIADQLPGKD